MNTTTSTGTASIPGQRPPVDLPTVFMPPQTQATPRGQVYGRPVNYEALRAARPHELPADNAGRDVQGELLDTATMALVAARIDAGRQQRIDEIQALLRDPNTDDDSRPGLRVELDQLDQVIPNRRLVNAITDALTDTALSAVDKWGRTQEALAARQATDCPGWCDDHLFGDDEETGRYHRGIVGEVNVLREGGDGTEMVQVLVVRHDKYGRPGRARVALFGQPEHIEFSPRRLKALARLLVKARRMVRADRRATREHR